jgi:hypothetical protein
MIWVASGRINDARCPVPSGISSVITKSDEGHIYCLLFTPCSRCDCGNTFTDSHIQNVLTLALSKAMYETIVLCLEFIIQVLQYGPPPTEYGNLPKDEIVGYG